MAFREVGVHEIREVLRLWLRGESLRSVERGENQLGDELLSRWPRRCARTGPTGTGRHGHCWQLIMTS
jgi:hypothetical protein